MTDPAKTAAKTAPEIATETGNHAVPVTDTFDDAKMTGISRAHAVSLARYDALTMLRNAATIANAGFAKSLEAALTGQTVTARDGLTASNAVLAAGVAFWQAVDNGTPYEGSSVEALIDDLGEVDD